MDEVKAIAQDQARLAAVLKFFDLKLLDTVASA
jgi:hypothetical protein